MTPDTQARSAAQPPWPLEAIWQSVVVQLPGFTVELLPTVDSTNSELMRRVRAGLCEPTLLVAERQTAGRGRLGRDWDSQATDVGVSVAESLGPEVGLKWPNDLWLADDRKIGGVLIETAGLAATSAQPGTPGAAGAAQMRAVLVGVGINISAPPPQPGQPQPPAGLRDWLPASSAAATLAQLVPALVAALQCFEAQGFAPFQARFNARDRLFERNVRLSDGREGRATGVDARGALRVQTAQGVQSITSSDVSVRPAPGA